MNNNKIAAMAAYISWIGFIIAIVIGDRSNRYVAHHLNQALVLNIISVLGGALTIIPILGGMAASVISLAVLVFWIMGIYNAYKEKTDPLPIIGDIHIIG